jgi:hypothetical protein
MRSIIHQDRVKSTEKKPVPIPDIVSVRTWVEKRITDILGEEDEIITTLVLEEMKTGNLHAALSGFLGQTTDTFITDLRAFAQGLQEAQKAAIRHAEALASLAALKKKIPKRQRSGSPVRERSRSR